MKGLYPVGTTCSNPTGATYSSQYDSWSNVTSRTYNGTTATLSYDTLDHLTQWNAGSTSQEYYDYIVRGARYRCMSVSCSSWKQDTHYLIKEREADIGTLYEMGQELQRWVELYQVEEKAHTTFWNYLDGYQVEEPEDFVRLFPHFSPEGIVLGPNELSFTTTWNGEFRFVEVAFPVFYHTRDMGMFHVLYRLSGDYLTDTWTD